MGSRRSKRCCAGTELHGVRVVGVEALGELAWDGVLITALDAVAQAEARLADAGCAGERVWRLS